MINEVWTYGNGWKMNNEFDNVTSLFLTWAALQAGQK